MTQGVWFMLFATLFFSLMNVAVKLLPHIPAVEIVFFPVVSDPTDSVFFSLVLSLTNSKKGEKHRSSKNVNTTLAFYDSESEDNPLAVCYKPGRNCNFFSSIKAFQIITVQFSLDETV